jgi:glycerate dehydrogenase
MEKGKLRMVFLDAASVGPASLAAVEAFGELVCHEVTTPGDVAERVAGCDVVLTNKVKLTEEIFAGAPGLRLVCTTSTGTDQVDLEAARRHGVVVCNVAGYATDTVAQQAVGLLINLASNIHRFDRGRANWPGSKVFCRYDYPVIELAGLTMGIVGYGSIGRRVGEICTALGMRVVRLGREGSDEVAGVDSLGREEFFRSCDAISLHAPANAETVGMINAEVLGMMKDGAFLINTGRGALIDEVALAAALREGRIGGAGLDVLSVEPPPVDHPLLAGDLERLVLTPHNAWTSGAALGRLVDGVAGNIRRYLEGKPSNRVA